MTQPQRIRLSRARGFRLPENAVNVARPGRWGNPFVVGEHGTRVQCCAMFHQLSRGLIDFSSSVDVDLQLTMYRRLRRHLGDLAGRDLACWCPLDGGACHGDVLIFLANPGTPVPAWAEGGIDVGRVRLCMLASDIEKHRRRKFKLEAKG